VILNNTIRIQFQNLILEIRRDTSVINSHLTSHYRPDINIRSSSIIARNWRAPLKLPKFAKSSKSDESLFLARLNQRGKCRLTSASSSPSSLLFIRHESPESRPSFPARGTCFFQLIPWELDEISRITADVGRPRTLLGGRRRRRLTKKRARKEGNRRAATRENERVSGNAVWKEQGGRMHRNEECKERDPRSSEKEEALSKQV